MESLLDEWARINTGSYHIAGLQRMAARLRAALTDLPGSLREFALGPQTLVSDRGDREVRELGSVLTMRSPARRGPRVLLAIHYDTVYPANDDFQTTTRIDDRTLRGPGVCDAKGGLLVLLFALLALENSPFAGTLRWEILLNPDEELGSPGSGPMFAEAAARNDLALLFEPALPDGALVSSRKGSGNFTLIVRGRAAHAGRDPQRGRNAIDSLAPLISSVSALQNEIPGIVVNTGFVHGGGPVNVVPDTALARFNVRVETWAQQEAFEGRLREVLSQIPPRDGIAVEVRGGLHCPPKILTPAIDRMLHHLRDCGEMLDLPLIWRPTGGACDGNRVAAAGVPAVDSLGVRGGNIHTDQEFVLLDSLTERARLTALYLMRLAAGDIQTEALPAPEEARQS
jgi:glutamate carboxypeptidase